jgi:hypothetical protein
VRRAWKRLFLLADFPPRLTLPWDNYLDDTLRYHFRASIVDMIYGESVLTKFLDKPRP